MESPRIDDIARRLFEGLPESARLLRRDIESNFRPVLQASLGRLDLRTPQQVVNPGPPTGRTAYGQAT